MLEYLTIILGSLGLTLIGSRLVGTNVEKIASGYLREIIQKFISSPTFASFWGIVIGFLVQSTSTVIFLGAGLIASDVIGLRRAMLLSSWASVGAAVIIFNLIFNNRELAFALIAIAGFSYLIKLHGIAYFIRDLILGFGLIYLGLNLMIPAIETISNNYILNYFSQNVQYIKGLYLLLMAIIIAFFTQGPTIFLVFALGSAGVLGLPDCLICIYGISIGSALFSWASTSQPGPLQHYAMKLSIYRVIISVLGTFVFLMLLFLEINYQIPSMLYLLELISNNIQVQIMWLTVLYIFFATVIATIFFKPIHKFLLQYSPLIKKEDPSKPKYIYKQATSNPHIAVDLLKKEMLRLMNMISSYIETCRKINIEKQTLNYQNLTKVHADFGKLSHEIEKFQEDLSIQNLSENTAANFLSLTDQHNHIVSLEESIYHLAYIIQHSEPNKMQSLIATLIESLDIIYITALDALDTQDAQEIQILIEITHDRKAILDTIRDSYLNQTPPLQTSTKSTILVMTSLSERIVWIFRRLGLLLTPQQTEEVVYETSQ